MKKVTILSGKGGVGKSSIAASLAIALSGRYKVIAVDCDVDASNLGIVLGVSRYDSMEPLSTNVKPVIDKTRCNSCGRCASSCHFDAIDIVDGYPQVKEFGCEGCGACEIVCPEKAISMHPVRNAKIGWAYTKYGFKLVTAQLDIGESGSGKIVNEVKNLASKISDGEEVILIDSAAGIGCPVIASVTGSDCVICVTEPTPSGMEDMKRAIALVEHFRIPYGIIINKHDINPDKTDELKNAYRDKIIAEIPFDKKFAESLVRMTPIILYEKSYEKLFHKIANDVMS